MAKFCKCETPVPNFDGTCKDCSRVLTWEWSTKFRDSKPVEMDESDEDEPVPIPEPKKKSKKGEPEPVPEQVPEPTKKSKKSKNVVIINDECVSSNE